METEAGTEHVQETAGTETQTAGQLFSDVLEERGRWQRGGRRVEEGEYRRKDKPREAGLENDRDVSPRLSGEPWLSHLLSFQDG